MRSERARFYGHEFRREAIESGTLYGRDHFRNLSMYTEDRVQPENYSFNLFLRKLFITELIQCQL